MLSLSGVSHKNDVILLSEDRRESLRRVIKAAAFLVSSIGSGKQAKNSEYGESTLNRSGVNGNV
jgi:hypothetical protein